MKIVSIEPTPSPNAMKITLDETLPSGMQKTYTPEHAERAPGWAREILQIPGVKSIFHTADFLSLERKAGADWQAILAQTGRIFGQEGEQMDTAAADEHFGEVKVYVQMFRGIPMQIRVRTDLPGKCGKACRNVLSRPPWKPEWPPRI